MSNGTTDIPDQSEAFDVGASDFVSGGFNPSEQVSRQTGTGFNMSAFPLSSEKSSPHNLAEELNEPNTQAGATMMVLDKDNNNEPVYITNKFYLQGMQMQFSEKVQLLETFGASSVSFFGESAKVYQFRGTAVDYPSQHKTYKTMHQSSLIQLYNNDLRGTRLVEENNVAVIKVFNHLIYGYPLDMNVSYQATVDKVAQFNMSWVTTRHNLALPGVASEQELEDLYDGDKVILDDQKRTYLNNLDKIINAISNLLNIEDQKLSKTVNGVTSYPGVSRHHQKGTTVVQPVLMSEPVYHVIKENRQRVFSKVNERVQTVINVIKNMGQRFDYISPKLAPFLTGETSVLDDLNQVASRASKSWEDYEKLLKHLNRLSSLQTDLMNFKRQIINLNAD